MPWHIEERDGKHCVIADADGENMGCSATREEAERHMAAIYANMDEMHGTKEVTETLVMYGGEVKALGGGKVGGYLVLFGSPAEKDFDGDYFTPSTDYGPHKTSLVHYQHGFDGKIRKRVLDDSAPLKMDEVGVWVEAQLNMRDKYEQAVYALVKRGKIGWSSGTAAHLVEREKVGNANKVTRWPLGLDASLTPVPCDPRNVATPLKSLITDYLEAEPNVTADYDFDALKTVRDFEGCLRDGGFSNEAACKFISAFKATLAQGEPAGEGSSTTTETKAEGEQGEPAAKAADESPIKSSEPTFMFSRTGRLAPHA